MRTVHRRDKKGIHRTRKGIIEVQFNWIFVAVAGAIIFLFIISIVMSQKKQSDQLLNVDIINQLTSSIRGKQQLTNTYNEIDSQTNVDMRFTCDPDTGLSDYNIVGTSASSDLPVDIIFTQKIVSSSTIQLWTQDFGMPFVVTRFMYITSPKYAIIIYNNSPSMYAAQLFNALPTNLTRFYASNADLAARTKSFRSYNVICFSPDCPNNNYNYLNITPKTADLWSYGVVTFHKASSPSNNPSTSYITKAGLLGAIFSENRDFYTCEMQRAFKQFNIKRDLQYRRLKILEDDLNIENPACVSILSTPEDRLYRMSGMDLRNVTDLYNFAKIISMSNIDADNQGCPQVI